MTELHFEREDYIKVLYRYLILLGIGVNIVGAEIAVSLNLPAYLDMVGTIFSAILMGPIIGTAVGFFTNIALGFLIDPYFFYFAGVNALAGFITGYIFKNYAFNIKTVLIASVIISIMSSLIGNAIAYFVFGGDSGAPVDALTELLLSQGYDLFLAVNITGFFSHLLDKLLSFVLVFYMIAIAEKNLKLSEFKINWK